MAGITIKLKYDKKTGKREVVIDYEKDKSALPFEHERKHKALVKQLLGDGVFDSDGDHLVGRVEENKNPSTPTKNSPKRQKQGSTG